MLVAMKKHLLAFALLSLAILGCKSLDTTPPEVKARIDFAQKQDEETPFQHVLIHASGKEKDVLEISVVDDVSRYAASGTVDLLVSDKLKREAKALGFKTITVKGGSRSWTEKDTINRTIDLR
jgi:hypothetical protein